MLDQTVGKQFIAGNLSPENFWQMTLNEYASKFDKIVNDISFSTVGYLKWPFKPGGNLSGFLTNNHDARFYDKTSKQRGLETQGLFFFDREASRSIIEGSHYCHWYIGRTRDKEWVSVRVDAIKTRNSERCVPWTITLRPIYPEDMMELVKTSYLAKGLVSEMNKIISEKKKSLKNLTDLQAVLTKSLEWSELAPSH